MGAGDARGGGGGGKGRDPLGLMTGVIQKVDGMG